MARIKETHAKVSPIGQSCGVSTIATLLRPDPTCRQESHNQQVYISIEFFLSFFLSFRGLCSQEDDLYVSVPFFEENNPPRCMELVACWIENIKLARNRLLLPQDHVFRIRILQRLRVTCVYRSCLMCFHFSRELEDRHASRRKA